MLCAHDLNKTFGGNPALKSVNCAVEPGKITVVIGPSGSGKSTLLRAISLLDPPDSGTVTIDDVSYQFPVAPGQRIFPSPWPRVTVVFQQLFLWPHLTLRENILMPARRRGVPDLEERFRELVESFGMRGFVDRFPNETSVGQRQRAATARALILHPAYVLLDEITSSLDVESVAAILNHLIVLRERGTGILLISHMLGFAQQAADRILFLEDGKVVESGGTDVLQKSLNPRVQRFVELMKGAQ